MDIFGSIFENNSVTGLSGGAISSQSSANTDITASRFTGNRALGGAVGGAVVHTGPFGGVMNLNGSIVENNSSENLGGGLYTISAEFNVNDSLITGNSAVNGGGIAVQSSNTGRLTLQRTTVQNNTATTFGGGAYIEGGGFVPSSLPRFYNSTFTGNSATTIGGGIMLNGGGEVEIAYSTIAENSTTLFANSVGGTNFFAGVANVTGTIIANNANADCSATNSSVSGDFNITTGPSGGIPTARWCSFIPLQANDQTTTDPLLGTLANNGNLGASYALQAGSPAIDAVPTDCPAFLNGVDQRGAPRPAGTCDVGAVSEDTIILPEVYFELPSTLIDDEGTVTTTQNINIIVDNTAGNLTAPGSLPLTIYVLRSGAASSASDYNLGVATPISFALNAGNWVAPGNTGTFSLPLNILDETQFEPTETVEFNLIAVGPGVLQVAQSTHLVTIIDDDIRPNDDDDDDGDSVLAAAIDTSVQSADNDSNETIPSENILETVEVLPSTGETPWWRNWVLAFFATTVLIFGYRWLSERRQLTF